MSPPFPSPPQSFFLSHFCFFAYSGISYLCELVLYRTCVWLKNTILLLCRFMYYRVYGLIGIFCRSQVYSLPSVQASR